ncbi:MAG TPA: FliM/FliN family flagellar motor switch protein [Gemmatimonadales bacterium]|nr:FliM/FliN family flagellar motor switch protein [Gemmatimonadales bacterium]
MVDALTQRDIDSLLQGAAPAPARPRQAVEIMPYNFLRPPRISRDRQATLNAIYGRFAVSLQALLSTRLRQPADVFLSSVEQATFAEFIFSLANPCAAFVFELGEKVGGQGVLDLGTDLSLHLIDRMFGGPGESRDLKRPLTPLERQVLKGVVERILALFQESWAEYLAFVPAPAGFESSPETLQIASREDNVLTANLEVRSGGLTGLVAVCLPLHCLESFLQEKTSRLTRSAWGNAAERAASRAQVERTVRGATLEVRACLPAFRLRARDVAALRLGQVVHTGHHVETPLELRVSGRRRFLATLGQIRKHLGLRITHLSSDARPEAPPMARGRAL